MVTENRCHKCDRSIGDDFEGRVLDGQLFCLDCLNRAGLGMLEPEELQLEEEIEFTRWGLLFQALWWGVHTTTLLASVLLLLVLTIAPSVVAMTLEERGLRHVVAGLPRTVVVLSEVWGVVWLVGSILLIPGIIAGAILVGRYRKVSIENGEFRVATRGDVLRTVYNLKRCQWRMSKPWCRIVGDYFPGRTLVLVTEQGYGRHQKRITWDCGFTDKKRLLWTGYFRLRDIPEEPDAGLPHLLRNLLLGSWIGAFVGIVAGYCAFLVSGAAAWTSTLGNIGMLDGMATAFIWFYYAGRPKNPRPPGTRSFWEPWLIAWLLGISVMLIPSSLGDENLFAVCLPLNTCIGWLLARYVHKRAEEIKLAEA